MKPRRIYVAGAYSADNVITMLDNIRRGIRASAELLLAGYSPFCPHLDYQFQLMMQSGEILTVKDYYRYSMDWLEKADAVLVLPGSEASKGTQAEIKRACELCIPVYWKKEDLIGK